MIAIISVLVMKSHSLQSLCEISRQLACPLLSYCFL